MLPKTSPQPASLDTDIKQIQAFIQNHQFQAASNALSGLLLQHQNHPDLLYMAAVCARYQQQFETADHYLIQLLDLHPGHSRALQEKAHGYRDQGDSDNALRFYLLAVQLNPALLAAWREQWKLLNSLGRQAQAKLVEQQMLYLQGLAKPLLAVMDRIAEGKLIKAEQLCRQFLQKVPHHIEAMRLLADIGVRLGALGDAEFLLESAQQFQPDYVPVQIDYINILRKRQKFQQALTQAKLLLAQQPQNPQFLSLYAIECMQVGDYQTAINGFDQVLAKLPKDPVTLTSKAHALKTFGDQNAAIHCYRQALASNPSHGEAWYSLANLKTLRFSNEDITAMEALASGRQKTQLTPNDRTYLAFALGKAYEDKQNHQQSFQYYQQGNQLKRAQSRYSAESLRQEFQSQQLYCTPKRIQALAGSGCQDPAPIFIVGLPRAGSTLLEQILASHSQVDGTLELPNILSLVHRLRRGERFSGENHYPKVIADLTPEQCLEFGEAYIRDTQIHRKNSAFFY